MASPNVKRIFQDKEYTDFLSNKNYMIIEKHNELFKTVSDKVGIGQLGDIIIQKTENNVDTVNINFEAYNKFLVNRAIIKQLNDNLRIFNSAVDTLKNRFIKGAKEIQINNYNTLLQQKENITNSSFLYETTDSQTSKQDGFKQNMTDFLIQVHTTILEIQKKITETETAKTEKESEFQKNYKNLNTNSIKGFLKSLIEFKIQTTQTDKSNSNKIKDSIAFMALYVVKQSILKVLFTLYILLTNLESCSKSDDMISQVATLLKNIKGKINNDEGYTAPLSIPDDTLKPDVIEINEDIEAIWKYIKNLEDNINNTSTVLTSSMSILQNLSTSMGDTYTTATINSRNGNNEELKQLVIEAQQTKESVEKLQNNPQLGGANNKVKSRRSKFVY